MGDPAQRAQLHVHGLHITLFHGDDGLKLDARELGELGLRHEGLLPDP